MAYAFVRRSGVIEFGRRCPPNTLTIASGSARLLRTVVSAMARQGYDGTTLLVPGVPEASSEREAVEAVGRFADRVRRSLSRSGSRS